LLRPPHLKAPMGIENHCNRLDPLRFREPGATELSFSHRLAAAKVEIASFLSQSLGCAVPPRSAGLLLAEVIGAGAEFPSDMTDPLERHARAAEALHSVLSEGGLEALQGLASRPLEFVLGIRLDHDPFSEMTIPSQRPHLIGADCG